MERVVTEVTREAVMVVEDTGREEDMVEDTRVVDIENKKKINEI